jgi:hypothetical protein
VENGDIAGCLKNQRVPGKKGDVAARGCGKAGKITGKFPGSFPTCDFRE